MIYTFLTRKFRKPKIQSVEIQIFWHQNEDFLRFFILEILLVLESRHHQEKKMVENYFSATLKAFRNTMIKISK